MEWNGMIQNSEIVKYTFFSYSSIALQEAMFIALQVVNIVFMS